MAQIRLDDAPEHHFNCGATLIHEQVLLTAAHCELGGAGRGTVSAAAVPCAAAALSCGRLATPPCRFD